MEKSKRIERLAEINNAVSYEDEQKLVEGMPGVDIRHDLPRDAGKLWRLHHHDMGNDDTADYNAICANLELPFERGVKMYYVDLKRLKNTFDALTENGFMVALNYDAMMAMQSVASAAATLGRKGGSSKSEAKKKASRENGKKGGRPKKKKSE